MKKHFLILLIIIVANATAYLFSKGAEFLYSHKCDMKEYYRAPYYMWSSTLIPSSSNF
nr:hypothetical protein [Mucilaginibacter sp. X4EP1]